MSDTISMLSRDEIRAIHDDIVGEYNNPEGMRNDVALDRVEMLPAEFFPSELASTMESVIRIIAIEHSFVDGNKRTAINCASVLAARAGYEFPVTKNLGLILKTLGVDQRVISDDGFESYLDESLVPTSRFEGLNATEAAEENREMYREAYDWLEHN